MRQPKPRMLGMAKMRARRPPRHPAGSTTLLRVLAAVTVIVVAVSTSNVVVVEGRVGNSKRSRMDWDQRRDGLTDRQFKTRYRLGKKAFSTLVDKIRPKLALPRRRGPRPMSAELLLSMALRWLAGGNYLDIADMHGVHRATFYGALWRTLQAINEVETLNFPSRDNARRVEISNGFLRNNHDSLAGCVGAIDGIAVRIRKPALIDDACPMTFYNRKGFFAVNVQAICDADCKFTWASCVSRGSTHDSTAWAFSSLYKQLLAKPLPYGFWIAGDDAYAASNQMLTPWPGKRISDAKDAFNYFQSSTRIAIERAFGILHARWGVLWRPLDVTLPHALLVVTVCMKLHNICVDEALAAREAVRQVQVSASILDSDPSRLLVGPAALPRVARRVPRRGRRQRRHRRPTLPERPGRGHRRDRARPPPRS